MTPSASMHVRPRTPRADHGVLRAALIALLFLAVAALSFAIDQSLNLSNLPVLQPTQSAGH